MKTLLRLLAACAVLAAPWAHAQTVDGVYVVRNADYFQGFINMTQLPAQLPQVLAPAQATGTFLCNNSGASAVPVPCAIGAGLAFSGSTLSATATPYSFSIGTPNTRTVSFSTAYQASNTAKAAAVNLNLTSSAALSLSGGTTNSATVYMGSTSGVASGTGTAICQYANSSTGALTLGLNTATIAGVPCEFSLPIGWYFAILQTSGTVTITSTFDQSLG